MANYANLKAAINANIKTNDNEEITGAILNAQLIAMVNSLGAGYQFVGIATPSTDPGTPDQNVYYVAAQAGTYTNFGGLVVNEGEVAVLMYNGTWSKAVTGAATAAQVGELSQEVDDKLDAPGETNNEYLRIYKDQEGKILFAITVKGTVVFNGGIGLNDRDYTKEDKAVVKSLRKVNNPEWAEVVIDSTGRIIYGVKTNGEFRGDGEKSLSSNDYTNMDKDVLSHFGLMKHPEFSLLIAKDDIPLFGLKRDGTLYPNVVGGLDALKKDVLKHRVPYDVPIEDTLVLPEIYNNVIATMYSYILEEIIVDNTPYFHFSKDLGKTWVTVENTIGDITHAHIFSDGTFLLCGRRKAYHTKDFETISESTLYDADGSVIDELSRDSFFTLGHHDVYNVVDGHEIEIWGEYVLDRNQNPKIWYTIDKGETVRSAFTFGVSEIDGSVVDCRHIHKVTYCKKDNTFYATTGDAYSSNEDHVLAGNINVNNNTWEWRHIADGRMFKFGIPFFDDVFMYAITDYTEAALYDQKGLLYTPISGIAQINSDISKFSYAYRFPTDEALTDTGLVMAPFDMVIDGVENKILFGDYQASGFLWFANKGYGFKRYRLSKKMLLGLNIIGPNFNGDIYTQAFGDGVTYTNEYFKLNRGRGYNLTEIFRANGVEDFMKQLNKKYNF